VGAVFAQLRLASAKRTVSSITRFGNLGHVFKEGESELLIGIARLAVLFEDLRLEIDALRVVSDKPEEERNSADQYRVMYFLRRGLSTLIEFRGGLTTVRLTAEFKTASLSAMDDGYIKRADQFLQEHWEQLKALRNEFGGHLQLPGVLFATQHFSNVVGSLTWHRADGASAGLECDFAGHVVAGAIASKLTSGADVRHELDKALKIISAGFLHAQAAMTALAHAFLWDRFGR
jgi:hypothetical protein